MEGLKNRMGQVWLPNRALSDDLRDEFFRALEARISDAEADVSEHHRWVVFSAYCYLADVASLRGPEGFLLDLDGLNQHRNPSVSDYVQRRVP